MKESLYGYFSFVCPHCLVYAQQNWSEIISKEEHFEDEGVYSSEKITILNTTLGPPYYDGENYFYGENVLAYCNCQACSKISIWLDHKMVYPASNTLAPPRSSMPKEVAALYEEARAVFSLSPRSSVALLRLALEVLLPHLGVKKGSINNMIAQLVEEGKAMGRIQEAMDALRVIGNNAVHPGTIDTEDLNNDNQRQVAIALFVTINFIVIETIESDAMIKDLYNQLPEGVLESIKKRDRK